MPRWLAHSPGQHPPTWQEEEWSTVITRPVAVLSLQPHVKCHPIQSPLARCVGFGQVFKVTPLQRRKEMRAEGISGQARGAQVTDTQVKRRNPNYFKRFSCSNQKSKP